MLFAFCFVCCIALGVLCCCCLAWRVALCCCRCSFAFQARSLLTYKSKRANKLQHPGAGGVRVQASGIVQTLYFEKKFLKIKKRKNQEFKKSKTVFICVLSDYFCSGNTLYHLRCLRRNLGH